MLQQKRYLHQKTKNVSPGYISEPEVKNKLILIKDRENIILR